MSTSLRQQFATEGFVVAPGFLDLSELAELRAHLERYVREVVPHLPDSKAFYVDRDRPETLKQLHGMSVDPWFASLREDPRWLGLGEDLLGESVTCHEPEWFDKPAGEAAPTPPHQDNYYFNLTPPQVLTIWLALDPTDEENGCLRYLPGSHREGLRPHGRSSILGFSQGITDYAAADREREIPIVLQPGDAVVHHGLMVHRADPNRSASRRRRAFAMVLQGVSCRRDEVPYARYLENLASQQGDLRPT
jgi:phytanoyl-CoA hydroxylase